MFMWKEFCKNYGEANDITTIYLRNHTTNSQYEIERTVDWYFYKKKNDIVIPMHLTMDLSFRKTNAAKTATIDLHIPYPQLAAFEELPQLLSQVKTQIEAIFASDDVDRVKIITSGKNYLGGSVEFRGSAFQTLSAIENRDISLTEASLQLIQETLIPELLLVNSYVDHDKLFAETCLVVYGVRGKQIASLLEQSLLGKAKELDNGMIVIDLLYPFARNTKKQHLSGYILQSGPPYILRNEGVLAVAIEKEQLQNYLEQHTAKQ